MISLFSPFDSSYFFIRFLSISGLVWLTFNNLVLSRTNAQFINSSLIFFSNFFYSLKSDSFSKIFMGTLLSFFFLISLINLIGVSPHGYAVTRRIRPVLFMSVSFWLRTFLFTLGNNFKGFISHFIPEGSPLLLRLFLFLIEIIRALIRPITLTVRLVANILSGHLLIILLCGLVLKIWPVLAAYIFLNLVEIFVSLIQSYIFCTLCCLYFTEVH